MLQESDHENDEEERDGSVYCLRDDASWMRSITEKICQARNHVALEYDVKQALGFRHAKGHRLWRRLKKKMVDLNLIKSFVASIDGKTSVCLEVLQKVRFVSLVFLRPSRTLTGGWRIKKGKNRKRLS